MKSTQRTSRNPSYYAQFSKDISIGQIIDLAPAHGPSLVGTCDVEDASTRPGGVILGRLIAFVLFVCHVMVARKQMFLSKVDYIAGAILLCGIVFVCFVPIICVLCEGLGDPRTPPAQRAEDICLILFLLRFNSSSCRRSLSCQLHPQVLLCP